MLIKWKKNKYHNVGTVPKSNKKIAAIGRIDTSNIQIHGRSLPWLSTRTSIKSGGVKRVYWKRKLKAQVTGNDKYTQKVRTLTFVDHN
jgi:hypothetical protein